MGARARDEDGGRRRSVRGATTRRAEGRRRSRAGGPTARARASRRRAARAPRTIPPGTATLQGFRVWWVRLRIRARNRRRRRVRDANHGRLDAPEMQRPPRDCLRVAGAPRDIAQNASPRAAFPESAEAPMNAGFAETGAAVERVARAGATAERVAITADIVTLHATCVRVRGAKQARARVRS